VPWRLASCLLLTARRPDERSGSVGALLSASHVLLCPVLRAGISLGGMHTWVTACLDERVAVACPMLGIQGWR